MQIFIRTVYGTFVVLSVELDDLIGLVKLKYQEETGCPIIHQRRLIFSGKHLDSFRTIQECGIINEASLTLLTPSIMRGGPSPPVTYHVHEAVVELLTGKLIYFNVNYGSIHTLTELKLSLQNDLQIPVSQQRLLLFGHKQFEFRFISTLDKIAKARQSSRSTQTTPPAVLVDAQYEVSNGFSGLLRNVVVHVCYVMRDRPFNIRAVFGMCREYFEWTKSVIYANSMRTFASERRLQELAETAQFNDLGEHEGAARFFLFRKGKSGNSVK